MDWILCDRDLRPERDKGATKLYNHKLFSRQPQEYAEIQPII